MSGNKLDILKEKNYTFLALKNEAEVFSSDKFGVLPAYLFQKQEIRNAVIIDKVTGKGSALMLSKAGCSEIYTGLISQNALEVFKKNNIAVHFKEIVPYIINRTGDGMCPVETMLKDTEDFEEAEKMIAGFLRKVWGDSVINS